MKIIIHQIEGKEVPANIEQQIRDAITAQGITQGNISLGSNAQGLVQIELDLPDVTTLPAVKRLAIKKWLYARGLQLESSIRDVNKFEFMQAVLYAKMMNKTFEGDDTTGMTSAQIEALVMAKYDVAED